MNITDIKKGQSCRIVDICGGKAISNKLDSLGIRTGACVEKISSQYFRGPITIQVGSTQVAIGHLMAKKILVECVV